MVVIRLARGGSKKRPFYSVVVTDKRNRRDSNFVDYNPRAVSTEQAFRVAADRLTYWSGVGAELSPTVKRLIKQHQAS